MRSIADHLTLRRTCDREGEGEDLLAEAVDRRAHVHALVRRRHLADLERLHLHPDTFPALLRDHVLAL